MCEGYARRGAVPAGAVDRCGSLGSALQADLATPIAHRADDQRNDDEDGDDRDGDPETGGHAERSLDFSLDTTPALVRSHAWALRELSRNLLHNAIKNTPVGSRLAVALVSDARTAALTISDSGPGISPALRERLFQPFSTETGAGSASTGSGLGLAICLGIVQSLGGSIELINRGPNAQVKGLDATVRLPLSSESNN